MFKRKSGDKGDSKQPKLESRIRRGVGAKVAEFENVITASDRFVQERLKSINASIDKLRQEKFLLDMDMKSTVTRASSFKLRLKQYLELEEKVTGQLLLCEQKASSMEWIADSREARKHLEERSAKLLDLWDRKMKKAKVTERVSFATQQTVLVSSSNEKDEKS